ncbi:alpha/beta hydrolase family protein [Mycobacterium deserti]|uniref:Alpha/beta hydrolase n=1 Tax=Mycobacterium deserti TaxID=2978347 RepID=A0ABT2M6G0_9MYCO|nr:hypothetical protein [Mycobacterium deserti]MCT7657845.1 hypothetical protein [Mycobacterium deserti]
MSSIDMAKRHFSLFTDPWLDFNVIRYLGYASQGGATVGEVLAILADVEDGDVESWHKAWSSFADRLVVEAQRLAAQPESIIDARRAYLRAANYYHASDQFLHGFDDRRAGVYQKLRAAFGKVCELASPPGRQLDYESDGVRMPMYFLPGSSEPEKYPTVIMVGGADVVCEENFFYGAGSLLDRGYNVALIELPGQVGSLALNEVSKYRADTEVPFAAMLDALTALDGVDPDNLWCVCFSAGGYFGPRAAAHDHRVRGWVFDASLHELAELPRSVAGVGEMLDGGADYATVDAHIESLRHLPAVDFSFHWWGRRGGDYTEPVERYSQIIEDMAAFTVTPEMIARISGPVLLVCGTSEPPAWRQLTRRMFQQLAVPDKELVELGPETGADAHTSVSALPVAEAVILPWLHRHAGPGARPTSGPGRP